MKKILTAIVLFVFVALPMSVMAMTAVSDNDLSAVTGQSGVSIGADVTMNITAGILAWGDSDGLGDGVTTAGWVGLSALNIQNMRIHMRADQGMIDVGVAFNLANNMLGGSYPDVPTFYAALTSGTDLVAQKAALASILATEELLTIDVYTKAGVTAVRIGIPTFEIDMNSLYASVGLWTDNAGVPGTYQEMGQIYMTKMVALLGKGNYVDISQNNTKSGVLINVGNLAGGNLIDTMTIASMAWGDTDGLGATTGYGEAAGAHAGWIGLTDFTMTALKVAATLNINVATPTGYLIFGNNLITGAHGLVNMTPAEFSAFTTALPALLASNDAGLKDTIGYILSHSSAGSFDPLALNAIGSTSVDIALQANISIGSLVATAALTPYGDLKYAASEFQGVLGQIYIKNLNVVIPPYVAGVTAASWVTISAH
jgi:hypothetical protein